MATIKFSKEAAKFMGAGKTWLAYGPQTHNGYGLWDTTASSAIFGGPAGTSTIHSVLNIYKGTVPTVSEFTDLAARESDLLLSFHMYAHSDHVLYIGFIDETDSHRYICGRNLNFINALRSGQATWFAAVNYEEPSQTFNQTSASSTWTVSISALTANKLFNEPINLNVTGIYPSITGTVSTLLSSTVTTSTAVFQFSTPATGTAILSYTATFFGGGFGGQATTGTVQGTIPADQFLYGTFTNAANAYNYTGAAKFSHYRRGAMIGTVGELYTTADLQILTTNIVADQRYNCAGIFLNFPQVWTI